MDVDGSRDTRNNKVLRNWGQDNAKGSLGGWPLHVIVAAMEGHIVWAYQNAGGGVFGEQVAKNFIGGQFSLMKQYHAAGAITDEDAVATAETLLRINKRVQEMRAGEYVQSFIRTARKPIAAQAGPATLCSYCGRPAAVVESDHVVAKSRGGDDGEHNRVPACQDCNARKSDKPFLIWLMEIGGMPDAT